VKSTEVTTQVICGQNQNQKIISQRFIREKRIKTKNVKKLYKSSNNVTKNSRKKSVTKITSQQSNKICEKFNQFFNGLLTFISVISLQGKYSLKSLIKKI